MDVMQWVSVLVSGLLGAIATLIVQLWWQDRATRKQVKIDCLRRVVAYRSGPPVREFSIALNEIFVTFNDSHPVVSAMNQFQQTINRTGGHSNDELVELIEAMMSDVGLRHEHIGNGLLLTPLKI